MNRKEDRKIIEFRYIHGVLEGRFSGVVVPFDF